MAAASSATTTAATTTAAAAAPFQWSLAALETLLAEDEMAQHAAVLRGFSVVELWRLRRVCRAFHRWGTAALAALPRVVAVGGALPSYDGTANVVVLDLSTLRWSSGAVPALPVPVKWHSACSFDDGRVVIAGGQGDDDEAMQTTLQWAPGATEWTALPDLAKARHSAAAVALPDGRVLTIGGINDDGDDNLASAEVLAADGSGWSALTPMGTARHGHVAATLPCGKVLVAGGDTEEPALGVQTAELWDPATGAWSAAPPMPHRRYLPDACVLPSGRVAVVGGQGALAASATSYYAHGESFDPSAPAGRAWQPLPPMARTRDEPAVAVVAGGMLAVGRPAQRHGPHVDELYDEASGRWFELPQPMAEPRRSTQLVSLPAAALAAPAAGAGAEAAAAQ